MFTPDNVSMDGETEMGHSLMMNDEELLLSVETD